MAESPQKATDPRAAPVDYCENCFYFWSYSTTDTEAGICRHDPPQIANNALDAKSPEFNFVSWWPEVAGKEWCGQHRNLQTVSEHGR